MSYSLGQALELLKTTELTPQALTNLVKQISIEASGNKTVLYSGRVPTGAGSTTSAAGIVKNMLDAGEDIRVVDKTPAARFLLSTEFTMAAGKASGLTAAELDDLVEGKYTGNKLSWLFGTDVNTNPWANVSKRFVEATTGEVRILTGGLDSTLPDGTIGAPGSGLQGHRIGAPGSSLAFCLRIPRIKLLFS